jgi:hypothetical protein
MTYLGKGIWLSDENGATYADWISQLSEDDRLVNRGRFLLAQFAGLDMMLHFVQAAQHADPPVEADEAVRLFLEKMLATGSEQVIGFAEKSQTSPLALRFWLAGLMKLLATEPEKTNGKKFGFQLMATSAMSSSKHYRFQYPGLKKGVSWKRWQQLRNNPRYDQLLASVLDQHEAESLNQIEKLFKIDQADEEGQPGQLDILRQSCAQYCLAGLFASLPIVADGDTPNLHYAEFLPLIDLNKRLAERDSPLFREMTKNWLTHPRCAPSFIALSEPLSD